MLAATLLVSLGIAFVGHAGLMTGGVVGLAFLIHYSTGISFGLLFFSINLPFYVLAARRMGGAFVLKTFAAVALLASFSEALPLVFKAGHVDPYYAAVIGGLLIGVGILILFRHRASLGGFNILVLYLQERFGWRAGSVQLALDASILLLSIPVVSFKAVLISLLCAAVLNLTLAINHRPGRYMGI